MSISSLVFSGTGCSTGPILKSSQSTQSWTARVRFNLGAKYTFWTKFGRSKFGHESSAVFEPGAESSFELILDFKSPLSHTYVLERIQAGL